MVDHGYRHDKRPHQPIGHGQRCHEVICHGPESSGGKHGEDDQRVADLQAYKNVATCHRQTSLNKPTRREEIIVKLSYDDFTPVNTFYQVMY